MARMFTHEIRASSRRGLLLVSLTLAACSAGAGGEVAHLPETVPKPAQAQAEALGRQPGSVRETTRPALPSKPSGRSTHYNATVEAHRTSTISSSVPGLIEEVHVKEGDRVAKGDVLAALDRTNADLRRRQAEAALRMARARANAARTESERASKLRADKAIPAAQLDRAAAQLDIASAGVAQAEAAVAMARQALRDTVIRAPYSGVIMRRMASEGEFASAMPPKMLVTLQELSPVDLRISIPAAKIGAVHVGSEIRVFFDDRQRPVAGTIARLSPAIDPRTRSLTAIAELPNPDGTLRPGLFAEVEISTSETAP